MSKRIKNKQSFQAHLFQVGFFLRPFPGIIRYSGQKIKYFQVSLYILPIKTYTSLCGKFLKKLIGSFIHHLFKFPFYFETKNITKKVQKAHGGI
jgi:hypothetical protein